MYNTVNLRLLTGWLMALACFAILSKTSAAQTNVLFNETFDTTNTPPGFNALGWDGGAGLSNVGVTYVDGAGVAGGRALVVRADYTQSGSGYVAYLYQNPLVIGNPSPALADYQLSFDVKVNHAGLRAIQCVLQSWPSINYGGTMTTTPIGSIPLGTYTPGTFVHVTVNLGDAGTWPGANTFNPAGGTWQIQLQVNGGDGAAVNTDEEVTLDNLAVTMTFSTSSQGTINWSDVHQRIDGFGASCAWTAPSLSDAQADMFFSVTNGIGLSLLRNRIAPDGTTLELATMQKAQARGARVWSTPWSPPAAFKDTNSVNGGDFVSSNYLAYARQLAGYASNMKSAGINLYAVSIQNEPEEWTTYESCLWTAQQFHDFVPYLHNALMASNASSVNIMLAEENCWAFELASNALNDTNTAAMIGVLAAHGYCGAPEPATRPSGLPLWETETATLNDNYNGSITNAVYWAGQLHAYLTVAEVNAWHFWWLIPYGSDNEGLTDVSGNPAKRMYALGNFSRFVRPNWYRIGVTNNNPAVLLSAYKDSASGNFALVAVNTGSAAITQVFHLAGFTVGSVTPWITSDTLSLVNQANIAVNGSSFTNTLPALSVTTFIGQANLPELVVAEQGNSVVLSWPTNIIGYSLQYSTNLAATNWLPVIVGAQNAVTNAVTNQRGFYRLVQP